MCSIPIIDSNISLHVQQVLTWELSRISEAVQWHVHACRFCWPVVCFAGLMDITERFLSAWTCFVQVEYDPDETGPRAMLAAIDDIGFEAELMTDRRYVDEQWLCSHSLHFCCLIPES